MYKNNSEQNRYLLMINRQKRLFTKKFSLSVIILLLPIIFNCNKLVAGPFIKISSIDAESNYPNVSVGITVNNLDKTKITGLSPDNFSIYEDGFLINSYRFKGIESTQELIYIVFSIDNSKSITPQTLTSFQMNAGKLIAGLDENEQAAIYRFNSDVIMLNGFTNNRQELMQNIDKIIRDGKKTLLYDAIYDALELLKQSENSQKGIIIFTDGKDEGSTLSADDVIRSATEKKIPLIFVASYKNEKPQNLSRLAKLTDGTVINTQSNVDVLQAYRKLADNSQDEYLLEYKTIIVPDKKKHQLEVKLKYKSLRDLDRKDFSINKSIARPGWQYVLLVLLSLCVTMFTILTVLLISGKKFSIFIKKKNIEPQVSTDRNFDNFFERNGNCTSDDSAILKNDILQKNLSYEINPALKENEYIKCWLVTKNGPDTGKKITLNNSELTLGSGSESDVLLINTNVSNIHAKIKKVNLTYYLLDMASERGTFVNGKKLLRPKALYDWDEIQICDILFIFRGSKTE